MARGGLLVSLYLMLVLLLATRGRLAVWLGVGLAIYFAYKRSRAAATIGRGNAVIVTA